MTTTISAVHTPGPWSIVSLDGRNMEIHDVNGTHVVCIGHYESGEIGARTPPGNVLWTEDDYAAWTAERLANARLIAAAPDLLAAAKRTLLAIEAAQDVRFLHERELLYAAIDKAEGR